MNVFGGAQKDLMKWRSPYGPVWSTPCNIGRRDVLGRRWEDLVQTGDSSCCNIDRMKAVGKE